MNRDSVTMGRNKARDMFRMVEDWNRQKSMEEAFPTRRNTRKKRSSGDGVRSRISHIWKEGSERDPKQSVQRMAKGWRAKSRGRTRSKSLVAPRKQGKEPPSKFLAAVKNRREQAAALSEEIKRRQRVSYVTLLSLRRIDMQASPLEAASSWYSSESRVSMMSRLAGSSSTMRILGFMESLDARPPWSYLLPDHGIAQGW